MTQATLNALTTRDKGSRNSRRLRAAGSIPGVVYGEGVAPLVVSVDAKEFRTSVSGDQGLNSLITLTADGKSYTVLARELQRHKVRGTVAHIDFQVVDPNKPVIATVPVHRIGDAVEVRHADWEIDQQLFSVELKARPADVPTHVDADISHLTPGATLHVGDLVLPAGVEAAGDKNAAVVSTRQGRVALVGGGQDAAAAAPDAAAAPAATPSA